MDKIEANRKAFLDLLMVRGQQYFNEALNVEDDSVLENTTAEQRVVDFAQYLTIASK